MTSQGALDGSRGRQSSRALTLAYSIHRGIQRGPAHEYWRIKELLRTGVRDEPRTHARVPLVLAALSRYLGTDEMPK